MITVHVWSYRGKNVAWGHASLQCRASYISYWPEPDGRVPTGVSRLATRVLGNRAPAALRSVYAASPIRNRTFDDDVRDEKQRPDHRIEIDGLDEPKIVAWWRGFGLDGGRMHGPMQAWHTTDLNCSTVVARALREGGGDDFASWLPSWNLVWRPDDVRRYAESIRHGLMSR